MRFRQNQMFQRIGLMMATLAAVLLCVVPAPGQDAGAATFKAKCAMCHGADGQGKTPMGAKLAIPSLSAPEVQKQTDTALVEAITKGKNKMPEFGSKLSTTEIAQVKTFIRTLKK